MTKEELRLLKQADRFLRNRGYNWHGKDTLRKRKRKKLNRKMRQMGMKTI